MIGEATKPDGVGCRSKAIDGFKELEIYDTGRFFTITGRHLPDTPTSIGKCQEAIDELCHRLWPKKQTESSHHPTGGFDGDDDKLIKIAIASKHGDRFERLLNGDTSGYDHDHSRADLALCNMLAFWTGRDPDRMDRIFRATGLYREKWEQRTIATGRSTRPLRIVQRFLRQSLKAQMWISAGSFPMHHPEQFQTV